MNLVSLNMPIRKRLLKFLADIKVVLWIVTAEWLFLDAHCDVIFQLIKNILIFPTTFQKIS